MHIQKQASLVVKDKKELSRNSLVSVSFPSHLLWRWGSSLSIQEGLRAKSPAATGRSTVFGLDLVDLGDSPVISIAGPAQSLFQVPPSPGHGVRLPQASHGFLPEAPLHLLPIPGPGPVISVLSGTSSTEPPHLHHEKQGLKVWSEENTPIHAS